MSDTNASESQDDKMAEPKDTPESDDPMVEKSSPETKKAGKQQPELLSPGEPDVDKTGDEPQPETSEHYKYDEHGVMIYTDPVSKVEYVLDSSGSTWVPKAESESKYKFDGKTYLYTDELSGIKHRWDLTKNDWVKIEGEDEEMETETERWEVVMCFFAHICQAKKHCYDVICMQ